MLTVHVTNFRLERQKHDHHIKLTRSVYGEENNLLFNQERMIFKTNNHRSYYSQ